MSTCRVIHSLNIFPEHRPSQKESTPNRQFSGAMLVSGRVCESKFTLLTCMCFHSRLEPVRSYRLQQDDSTSPMGMGSSIFRKVKTIHLVSCNSSE